MARKKAESTKKEKNELMNKIDAIRLAVNKASPSEWSGDDAILLMRSDQISRIPTFSSGSFDLDMKMGGGYAWGRIIEIYGPESSGKSTLTLHAIANVQKEGKICALIDSENSFDAIYAQSLGVDVEKLLVSQPDCGEHALNVMMESIRNGVNLVVIDSVAALTPRDMFEAAAGTVTMGKHAKMMSEGVRNLNTLLMKTRASVLFTNQIRTQIGVAHASMASGTTGGHALRFYSSQRLEVKRVGSEKSGDEIVSNLITVKLAKNKIAPPFRVASLKIRFGKGVDPIEQVIDYLINNDVIEKSGAWFTVTPLDNMRFQGREKIYKYLEENENDFIKLQSLVKEMFDESMKKVAVIKKDKDSEDQEEEDGSLEDVMNSIQKQDGNEDIEVEEI